MNYTFNKWHLYLATLAAPLGIIFFIAYVIIAHNYLPDGIMISNIIFSILSIVSYLGLFYEIIRNRKKICKAEIAYTIISFVCMIPLYFISGFFFAENLNIHL